MGYSLDQKSMQLISYFENISGAQVDDCVTEDNRIIYIVKKGQAGLAIGKKGANIKKAMRDLRKEIEIIENGDNAQEFIKNALAPAEVQEVTISEGRAMVKIDANERGLAIGKGGAKIDRCRKLLERHFDIKEVILTKM
jgi:N utilization substance protein A